MFMNSLKALRFLAAMAFAAAALKVSANGFRLPDQDAFATARGEAFVATADNPSAIYYNPAGITQLKGDQLRAGIYAIYLDPTFTPPGGGRTYQIRQNFGGIPQLFYTHTLESFPLSFGLGVYVPYGGSVTWPHNTGFNAVATKGSLTYLRVNPVVAYKILPSLSIAAGAMVNYARIDLEQDLRPYPSRFANFFRFSGEGWSAGYNLGLLWQPVEKISLGATFRSATTMPFEGETKFELQPLAGLSTPQERRARADFEFPMTVVCGLSYRPTPKWNLEFDADYTDWSSFGVVNIHQVAPPRPFTANVPVTLNWQPSWMYEFGATRYFDNGWHASAGYVFNENSVPDARYTPLAADLDRHFLSVGVGRKGKKFDFDMAYQFGYGPDRTVTGSKPSSKPADFANQKADGTYEFMSHAVIVTVGMHF